MCMHLSSKDGLSMPIERHSEEVSICKSNNEASFSADAAEISYSKDWPPISF